MSEETGFRVLITGGSSGVGEYLALRLSENVKNQIYVTGRNLERLNKVVIKVNEAGARGYFRQTDVSSSIEAEQTINDAIAKMGGLDVLVANSGVGVFKSVEELTDEDIDIQFQTNVYGVFNYLRPALKHMRKENQGQIIVTSSNLGFNVTSRGSVYCATKYAVQAIIGCLRDELKGTQIKAATVNPGAIDTPWFSDYSSDQNPKRLDVEEVVDAFMLIINQGNRSNIDHILLNPTNRG